MTSHRERLSAEIDGRREEYTTLLRQLLAASEGGEEATQELVATRFRELGCQVETIRQDPSSLTVEHEFASDVTIQPGERVSVVGRLPGAGDGRSLVFFAHPDGEPVGSTETWEHPPFAGVVEGGRIYGWGVADDLMGVATMVAALDAVITAGLKPTGDVILASTASKRHARGVIAAMNRGYVADGAIYLHPAESGKGLREIKAFTSGLLRFRITVSGRPPDTLEPNQTAFYHLAVNPIDKAVMVYQALRSLADRRAREVNHPLMEAAIGRSTNLQLAHMRSGDEKKLGIVAKECVLAGSITFPPGETMADVQKQVEDALHAVGSSDEWLANNPPRLEWLMGASAAEVPADHPLYQTVSASVAAVTGVEPVVYPLHSASDIRHPMLHSGIPTVGLGSLAGNLSQAGGSDEWVDLDDYLRAVKICASAIIDWCGVQGQP